MIESYSFGEIIIDGKRYSNDLKIFPDEIKDNWWRDQGHEIHREDIDDILNFSPDVLIVGTGANGRLKISKETIKILEGKGIELISEKTEKAVEKYNDIHDEKEVVAAFHLTC